MGATDIIAAIATAPGRGGIGIVRVSGPGLHDLVSALLGHPLPPRRAVRTHFLDRKGAPIDEGVALFFSAPQSYTGEDVLELQGHGGPVVLQLLLKRCLELGARPAEAGEFTKRAFLNDKLDLAQAESVADLIDANTAEAARSAMRSLQGAFSERINGLLADLITLRMAIEASLDFPEEDIAISQRAETERDIRALLESLDAVMAAAQQGSLLREGMHIVLVGRPNVGKSSLLNQLAGNERAIVTPIPGTTRDALRETIEIEGVPAHIIDTAGLREADDPVERMGIARTWDAVSRADLAVLLHDSTQPDDAEDRAILQRLPPQLPRLRVMNKIDLLPEPRPAAADTADAVWVSAKTGEGIDRLRGALLRTVGWRASGEGVYMARERHLVALAAARHHLEAAMARREIELCAEELRLAQERLAAITGAFTADDLLGEIFSRFCIGK